MPALATPLAEEVLFRGFLRRQLRRRAGLPLWLALTVSSAFFGMAHGTSLPNGWPTAAHVVAIGLIGVLLGAIFVVSRENLWVPIGVHFGMNLWAAPFEAPTAAFLAANVARLSALTTALVVVEALSRRARA